MAHIWRRFLSWLHSYFFGCLRRPKKSRRPRTFKPRVEQLPDRTMIGADVSLGGAVLAATGGAALLGPALYAMMQPGQAANEPVQSPTFDYGGQVDSGLIAPGQLADPDRQPGEIVMGVWPAPQESAKSEPVSEKGDVVDAKASEDLTDDPLANPIFDPLTAVADASGAKHGGEPGALATGGGSVNLGGGDGGVATEIPNPSTPAGQPQSSDDTSALSAFANQHGEPGASATGVPAAPTVQHPIATVRDLQEHDLTPQPSSLKAASQLPKAVRFEENRGPVADGQTQFIAHAGGSTLLLQPNQATYVLPSSNAPVHMQFVGANPNPEVVGQEQLVTRTNYLLGDQAQWITDVPNFARVSYIDLYPGVNQTWFTNSQGQLEYDLVVAPQANPDVIQFEFSIAEPGASATGVPTTTLDAAGNLIVTTPAGAITQHAPIIYQEINGMRQSVAGGYALTGNTVSFEIGAYDPWRPLIIDPVIAASGYLGGTGNDQATGVALGPDGAIYVTGWTDSTNFPVVNQFQVNQPSRDIFVTKVSADGSTILYSTFIGGGSADQGNAIAVDSLGNAWVAGQTDSTNFPTQNPFQTNKSGRDAFLLKLNPAGNGLVFSTYLGGSSQDVGTGVAVDASGNAFAVGFTDSTDFQTLNAIQGNKSVRDAWVYKFTSAGSAVFGTYLGGNATDEANGVAVDANGFAYVVGDTTSTDFAVVNPFQAIRSGNQDVFLTKMAPNGQSLVYSTYLGGSANDIGTGVAVDAGSQAYVTGWTESRSTPFPTMNAFQSTLNGPRDAFVTKFSSAGNALVFSTYLGGSGNEQASAIAVDSGGRAHVTGFVTTSTDFPLFNPIQFDRPGDDVFVSILAASGNALTFSTYLGGSTFDHGVGIAIAQAGDLVAGWTDSPDFPTVGPLGPVPAQEDDAFVLLITNAPPIASNDAYTMLHDGILTQDGKSGSTFDEGVLLNDFDPDGEPLTARLVSGPTNGQLSFNNNDGTFIYVPNAGFVGTDSFSYVANDGTFDSNLATVTIEVVNTAPVARDDSYDLLPNTDLLLNAAEGVLTNDFDVNGDTLSAELVPNSGPSHGTLDFFDATGAFKYTPNSGFTGTDTFQYRAKDGIAPGALAMVFLRVDAESKVSFRNTTRGGDKVVSAKDDTLGLPGGVKEIDVQVLPKEATATLKIARTKGNSGSAVFKDTGTDTTNVTGTKTITILGRDVSDQPRNMQITATINNKAVPGSFEFTVFKIDMVTPITEGDATKLVPNTVKNPRDKTLLSVISIATANTNLLGNQIKPKELAWGGIVIKGRIAPLNIDPNDFNRNHDRTESFDWSRRMTGRLYDQTGCLHTRAGGVQTASDKVLDDEHDNDEDLLPDADQTAGELLIWSFDAPGITPARVKSPENPIARARRNFVETAFYAGVKVSADLPWFWRASVQNKGGQDTLVQNTDVTSDNVLKANDSTTLTPDLKASTIPDFTVTGIQPATATSTATQGQTFAVNALKITGTVLKPVGACPPYVYLIHEFMGADKRSAENVVVLLRKLNFAADGTTITNAVEVAMPPLAPKESVNPNGTLLLGAYNVKVFLGDKVAPPSDKPITLTLKQG